MGLQVRTVERFAWQDRDGEIESPDAGSVHLWFEDGRGLHLDTASDWTLRWSISEAGSDLWMRQYRYECAGRWVRRDASLEDPFAPIVGLPLSAALSVANERNETVGVTLVAGTKHVKLRVWEGELHAEAAMVDHLRRAGELSDVEVET